MKNSIFISLFLLVLVTFIDEVNYVDDAVCKD